MSKATWRGSRKLSIFSFPPPSPSRNATMGSVSSPFEDDEALKNK